MSLTPSGGSMLVWPHWGQDIVRDKLKLYVFDIFYQIDLYSFDVWITTWGWSSTDNWSRRYVDRGEAEIVMILKVSFCLILPLGLSRVVCRDNRRGWSCWWTQRWHWHTSCCDHCHWCCCWCCSHNYCYQLHNLSLSTVRTLSTIHFNLKNHIEFQSFPFQLFTF